MTTDRDLLTELFTFLQSHNYITMDDKSLTDMVQRYQNPPLTALNRVAMQMTTWDYNALGELMTKVDAHLKAEEIEDAVWVEKQKRKMKHVS